MPICCYLATKAYGACIFRPFTIRFFTSFFSFSPSCQQPCVGLMYSRVHHSPMEPELVSREKALSTWRTPWHEGFCINALCGFSGGYNLKEGHKKIEDAFIASSTSILFSIRISRRHTRGAPTAMLTQSLHTQECSFGSLLQRASFCRAV